MAIHLPHETVLSSGSEGEFTKQLLAYSVPVRCIDSDENQTPSPHHWVLVVTSDSEVMPSLIFTHGLRLNTEIYIKLLE